MVTERSGLSTVRVPQPLAMLRSIWQILEQRAENPMICRKELEVLAEQHPEQFRECAITLLLRHGAQGKVRPIGRLLVKQFGLIEDLCNPDAFSSEDAQRLARVVGELEPGVDERVALLLQDCRDQVRASRLLELLQVIPPGGHSTRTLRALLHLDDDRLKSKAVLLLGQRADSAAPLQGALNAEEGRVRANAVESLWDKPGSDVFAALWNAAEDSNNRVVGNALLGLHRAGDVRCISRLIGLADHPEGSFRLTAAWAMGETGNPRFFETLTRLASDRDEGVRGRADRALLRLAAAASAPPKEYLQVDCLTAERTAQAERLTVAVTSGATTRHPLKPTFFALWDGPQLIQDYSVSWRPAPPLLRVAFAICDDELHGEEVREALRNGVVEQIERKRERDEWCIASYCSRIRTSFSWQGREEIAEQSGRNRWLLYRDARSLQQCLQMVPQGYDVAPAVFAGVREAIRVIGSSDYPAHVILLAAGEAAPEDAPQVEETVADALRFKVAVSAVVLNRLSGAAKRVCTETGGRSLAVARAVDVGTAIGKIMRTFGSRYEITYPAQNAGARLVRLAVCYENGYGETQFPAATE